ncbi:MAG TPA: substrate-binding domain-containing protein, partial [Xanthobacteraceae bacterium]|nr:substrate-binding domain-containing protein [Xanthobacteraceae bacterium]
FLLSVFITHATSNAAEVKFLCGFALESAMKELVPEFQKTTADTVIVFYASVGAIANRVRQGEIADVAIVSPEQSRNLEKEGKIIAAAPVAKVGIGVAVKKGAGRPDISTVDAFKRALLGARSIAMADPARGSPVSAYLVGLFDRLGIGPELRGKTILMPSNVETFDALARGDAEIAASQVSEIVASPYADLVGPLPSDIQNFTVLTATVPKAATAPEAAKAFIEFLTSSHAGSIYRSKGMEPG